MPRPGDILLTARGTLGRCYIVQSDDEFYFQDGMISCVEGYSIGTYSTFLYLLIERS